jgi:hypothetical protein
VKVDPNLGGQWKEKERVLCLVANGRRRRGFFAWWPMEGERRFLVWWLMEGEGEGSWLGGQCKEKEKVLGWVANARRRRRFLAWWPMEGEGEGSLLPIPTFPQATLLKPSFFIL